MTLWRRASTFDPERAKLTTWLLAIARNKAIELLRQRQRRPEVRPVVEPAGEAPDAVEAVAAGDEAELVATAMADLPSEQYEVVRLAYFDGLSHAEISQVIGVPLGTVKGRMRLALTRLRGLVETAGLTTDMR